MHFMLLHISVNSLYCFYYSIHVLLSLFHCLFQQLNICTLLYFLVICFYVYVFIFVTDNCFLCFIYLFIIILRFSILQEPLGSTFLFLYLVLEGQPEFLLFDPTIWFMYLTEQEPNRVMIGTPNHIIALNKQISNLQPLKISARHWNYDPLRILNCIFRREDLQKSRRHCNSQ